MKKKLLALFLALSLCTIPLSACGSEEPKEPTESDASAGEEELPAFLQDENAIKPDPATGWIDSDIKGYFDKDIELSLKDDFAATVNKDLYATGTFDGAALENIGRKVTEQKRELVNDESVTGKNIEEVRKFIGLAEDMDRRNSLGVEPLKPYIENIENINTVDELYSWITDVKANPLGVAPLDVAGASRSVVEPESYFVSLSKPTPVLQTDDAYYSLSETSLENMVQVEDKVTYILGTMGYSGAQITDIIHRCYQFEKMLISQTADLSLEDEEDVTYTKEEIEFIQGDYPLIRYLDSRGFGECTRYLADSDFVKKIDRICETHIDDIKAMSIVKYIIQTGLYLDEETYNFFVESSKKRGVLEETENRTEEQIHEDLIFKQYLARTALEGALDAEYVKKYIDPGSYDRLYSMTEEIIDTYRMVFSSEPWLSEEGKKACLEKLDEIKIHVVKQDEADYSSLNIKSAADGGNFLEAFFEVNRFGVEKTGEFTSRPVNRNEWDPYNFALSTTTTNAFYYPQTNGIYILAGILEDPAYFDGMTDEELFSGIGTIVGHEVTHGFDYQGVKFDKYGIENSWLPEGDEKSFQDATAKVSLFYSSLKPYSGSGIYNGTNVQGEAVADMGGMRVTLEMAKKRNDFDYDKYFRHYASIWAAQRTLNQERSYFTSDPHPLNFYRINVVVSQFDEFQKTYDIKEGDKMYVAPEKRIAVW